MGRPGRVPPARAVRSVSKKDTRPRRIVVLGTRFTVRLDQVEQARLALGMPPKTCDNCKRWVNHQCVIASYWICWGLMGHRLVYPPPGWEQK